MSEEMNHIVRSAFENDSVEKAPNGLWSEINDELSQSSVDIAVKEGFEGQKVSAPEMVWERVQDQLDIDRVWLSVANKIRIRRYGYFLQFAAMVLLLLLPFNLDYTYFDTANIGGSNSSVQAKTANLINSVDRNNDSQILDQTVSNNLSAVQSNVAHSSPPVVNINPQESSNNSPSDYTVLETRLATLKLTDLGDFVVPNIQPLVPSKSKRSIGLMVGVVSSLENTWILDNETRSGFDVNSLTENEFSLGASYGLFAEYQIKPRFSITAEYLFQSQARQHSDFYESGTYAHKEKEINSYKISLAAGWITQPKYHGVLHSTVARFGGYYTGVKSNYTYINEAITEVNSIYKRHDVGLRFEFGKRVYLNSIALEGGLKVDYGLSNLASYKSYIPAHLNFTRIVSGGLYLKAAYAF